MATPRDSVRDDPAVRDERIRNVLKNEINRALNVDRRMTKAELVLASGVNVHTIDAILSRETAKHRRIKADVLMSLMLALGERTVNLVLAQINYGGAVALEEQDDRQPLFAMVECFKHFTVFVDAAKDNRIDHLEVEPVAGAADGIIAEMIPFSSARGGK